MNSGVYSPLFFYSTDKYHSLSGPSVRSLQQSFKVMVIWIIIGVLLLLFLAFLFMPLNLVLDTRTHDYYVQAAGLAKMKIEGDEKEIVRFRLQALFRSFIFYPLDWIDKPKRLKEKREKKQRKKKKTTNLSPRTILRVLKSFKVKRFWVHLDTGDCIANAKIYPAFALFNYLGGNFGVNFHGRNELVLHLQNRPIRLLRSFVNL